MGELRPGGAIKRQPEWARGGAHHKPNGEPSKLNPAVTESPARLVFGKDTAPKTEGETYHTLGVGTWLFDSPDWEADRIRLGRADKLTRVRELQSIRQKNKPDGRIALEVQYDWMGNDGQPYSRRFWVHPQKGGFYGMPPAPKVGRPTLKL